MMRVCVELQVREVVVWLLVLRFFIVLASPWAWAWAFVLWMFWRVAGRFGIYWCCWINVPTLCFFPSFTHLNSIPCCTEVFQYILFPSFHILLWKVEFCLKSQYGCCLSYSFSLLLVSPYTIVLLKTVIDPRGCSVGALGFLKFILLSSSLVCIQFCFGSCSSSVLFIRCKFLEFCYYWKLCPCWLNGRCASHSSMIQEIVWGSHRGSSVSKVDIWRILVGSVSYSQSDVEISFFSKIYFICSIMFV